MKCIIYPEIKQLYVGFLFAPQASYKTSVITYKMGCVLAACSAQCAHKGFTQCSVFMGLSSPHAFRSEHPLLINHAQQG